MKKIGILGSTGSIGTQTLDVLGQLDGKFKVKYLTAYGNAHLLSQQALKFKPDTVCIINKEKKEELETYLQNSSIKITSGRSALLELSSRTDVDLVMNGLVGASGMEPTICSIKSGVDVALSNKESLVMAGKIINNLLQESSSNLYPVDSEHSAIWQCLTGEDNTQIKKLILTGSGGPFRKKDKNDFRTITLEDALQHPNWNMGNKITIDSATMMNKGLEVIEAYWLFGMNIDQIDIIIHPQSIIHSMVEFNDGSVKAQLGLPNMKIPIQYALTYPNHLPANFESLDLINIGSISFEKPDLEKFPCIRLSYEALQEGGSFPIVLNIANDTAVTSFLNKHIQFNDIPRLIENALNKHTFIKEPNMKNIIELSHWTESYVHNQIAAIA
tara:strand:- start:4069 stop:5226 length:1158 start_codon:yes stop_codon:yes gene_type:complete